MLTLTFASSLVKLVPNVVLFMCACISLFFLPFATGRPSTSMSTSTLGASNGQSQPHQASIDIDIDEIDGISSLRSSTFVSRGHTHADDDEHDDNDSDGIDHTLTLTGSGHSQLPLLLSSTPNQYQYQNNKDNNEVRTGNEIAGTRVVERQRRRRRASFGDSNTPDFKSLVHGLEAQDPQSSQEVEGNDDLEPGSLNLLPVGSGAGDGGAASSTDISQLTALISTSLSALTSAAVLASNASAYLQDMLSTVQANSAGIVSQVEVLKNLTVELGVEVAKPMRTIEPLMENQIEFALSITRSVNTIGDKVGELDRSITNLLTFAPLVLISSLATNLVSFIMLMCLLCTCVNMKRLRRAQADANVFNARRPSAPGGGTISTLPFAFRNLELDDIHGSTRNTLRTQF